ncbi:TRAP transporter small permease subunit [Phytoactinopolyspora mesophila]|uniref:TRAP transporter small permease subunit n=1 Tax=Phytoactinopolyspora mesophila TaxID=2650750 RepID=A0A7K3LX26_9ACTN|nr:TRAP transporter small permease subunit [Phytoactinopolyspora mesophila]
MTEPTPGYPGDEEPAEPVRAVTAEQLRERHGGPLTRALVRVNTVLHLVAGVVMVALLLWTVGDIVGRAVFSHPLRGTIEMTELAVVVLVYLGLALTEDRDRHITVDLLYVRLGATGQLVLRVFAGVVAFVVVSVMTWRLWQYAEQLDAGGFTTGILRIPLYPVALLAVLGSSAFALAILSKTILAVKALAERN